MRGQAKRCAPAANGNFEESEKRTAARRRASAGENCRIAGAEGETAAPDRSHLATGAEVLHALERPDPAPPTTPDTLSVESRTSSPRS